MGRYADGQHDLAIAKLLATILFTTRAQPLLYYGQELGVPASPARPDERRAHHRLGRPTPATKGTTRTPNRSRNIHP